jgi:hypothetical protein
MGVWDEGDVCEIHDSPDECAESDLCDMEGGDDESDTVCGIHLFSGECTEECAYLAEEVYSQQMAHLTSK